MRNFYRATYIFTLFQLMACDSPVSIQAPSSSVAITSSVVNPQFNSAPTHAAFFDSISTSPIISFQVDPQVATSIEEIQYQVLNSQNVSISGQWTEAPSNPFQIFNLVHTQDGGTYPVCIRAVFKDGNHSTAQCSGGWTIDVSGPQLGSLSATGISNTSYSAQWSIVSQGAGISSYLASITSTAGEAIVSSQAIVPSCNAGVCSYQFTGLSLDTETTYKFWVVAIDSIGVTGQMTEVSTMLTGDVSVTINSYYITSVAGGYHDLCNVYTPHSCTSFGGTMPVSQSPKLPGCTHSFSGNNVTYQCGYSSGPQTGLCVGLTQYSLLGPSCGP